MDQTPAESPADLCFDDGNEDALSYGLCGRRNQKTTDRTAVTCTPCLFLFARSTGPRCGKPIGVSHQPCTLNAGHKEGHGLAVVSTLHGPCAIPGCTSDAFLPHDFHMIEGAQGARPSEPAAETAVCPACGEDVSPAAMPAHLLSDVLECQHDDTMDVIINHAKVQTCEDCGAFRCAAQGDEWHLPPLVKWLTDALTAAQPQGKE